MLKPCPFCESIGKEVEAYKVFRREPIYGCVKCHKFFSTAKEWDTRPIEDALRRQIAEKDKEIDWWARRAEWWQRRTEWWQKQAEDK